MTALCTRSPINAGMAHAKQTLCRLHAANLRCSGLACRSTLGASGMLRVWAWPTLTCATQVSRPRMHAGVSRPRMHAAVSCPHMHASMLLCSSPYMHAAVSPALICMPPCAGLACRSTSGASGMLRVWISSTCSLPAASGGGTNSSISRRPGRSRAASMAPGRLVAATTCTPAGRGPCWMAAAASRHKGPGLCRSASPQYTGHMRLGLQCWQKIWQPAGACHVCAHRAPQHRCCVQQAQDILCGSQHCKRRSVQRHVRARAAPLAGLVPASALTCSTTAPLSWLVQGRLAPPTGG